jgi:hypothetical protein
MFDLIVVGARCTGAPTAMLLARVVHKARLSDEGNGHSHEVGEDGWHLAVRRSFGRHQRGGSGSSPFNDNILSSLC